MLPLEIGAKTAAAAGPGDNLRAGRVDRAVGPVAATAARDHSAELLTIEPGGVPSADARFRRSHPRKNSARCECIAGPAAESLHGSARARAAGDLSVIRDDAASGHEQTSAAEARLPGPRVAVPPKPAPPMPPVITPVAVLVNEPPPQK